MLSAVFLLLFLMLWGFHGFATLDSAKYDPPEKNTQSQKPNEPISSADENAITSLMRGQRVFKKSNP